MGLIKFLKDKFTKKKDENSLSLSSKKDESLDKYDKGLEKSRKQFSNKLDELTKKYKLVNEDYFEELEEILIEADCGVSFTLNIIDELLEDAKNHKFDIYMENLKKIIDGDKDFNEYLQYIEVFLK